MILVRNDIPYRILPSTAPEQGLLDVASTVLHPHGARPLTLCSIYAPLPAVNAPTKSGSPPSPPSRRLYPLLSGEA